MARMRWDMDGKRHRKSVSLADEREYRQNDAAARYLERASAREQELREERRKEQRTKGGQR